MEGFTHGTDQAPDALQSCEEEKYKIEQLKRSFDEDFEMFLLDNILMSAQFFENYERDIGIARQEGTSKDSDLDQFTIFEADTLHELVARKVLFQAKSDAVKNPPESLHPIRLYVSYKHVELAYDSSSFSHFKPSGVPYYKLIYQGCENDTKEDSGYFNLILSEGIEDTSDPTLIQHPDCPEKVIRSDAVLNKNDQFYYLKPENRSMPYPVGSYRTYERLGSTCSIPKSCFKEVDKQTSTNNKRRTGKTIVREMKTVKEVLLSAAFKRHFTEVFIQCLWDKMNFQSAALDSGVFDHDHLTILKKNLTHHVIPVLEMKSYHGITYGFEENKTGFVEWPTKSMKEVMERNKCHLLPEGYYETTEANNEDTDYTLEWKVIFPKSEKYLLMHMMHAHIKCYLFTLLLYKSFIETKGCFAHFGPSHIANLLFLMVRRDFTGWPEYSQGETLFKFLKALAVTIQKKSLKSFFLPKRNLYAGSFPKYLNRAQTLISLITQNPIPHILKALMNLKYAEGFYPEMDYLKLYNILTVEDLQEYLYPTPPKKLKGNKKNIEPPKIGKDSIDENELFQVVRSPFRDREILRFFIHHFIEVAKQSLAYEGKDYAMLYIVHTRRLLAILLERGGATEYYELENNLSLVLKRCRSSSTKNNVAHKSKTTETYL